LSRLLVVASATVGALLVPVGAAQAAPHNQRPAIPSGLSVSGVACGGEGVFAGTDTPEFAAVLDDPDFGAARPEEVTPTFALWPVGHRDQRIEWPGTPLTADGRTRSTPAAALTDGVRYRFEVRATDAAGARSRWSPACTFTIDRTAPHPPSVTSTDYPSAGAAGGPGIPGRFTFAVAGGDTDVVAFRWSGRGVGLTDVPVGPDGTATVEFEPAAYGMHDVTVQAIDRTRNRSATTTYAFTVRNTEPRLTDLTPDAGPGEEHTFHVSPGNLGGLVAYDYRLNDEPAVRIGAGPDGSATFVVRPTAPGANTVSVIGHTADGLPTGVASRTVHVVHPPTTPTVSSPDLPGDGGAPPLVGQELTLRFHPGAPGVTEYIWSADFGATEHVVAAGPDGTATVRYTPRDWPYLLVQVRSRTSDGAESPVVEFGWELTSHAPQVASPEYPMYGAGSGSGTFTFTPARDGVTGYEYSFNGGPAQTAEGGTATITWTPERSGWVTLLVRQRIGDLVSDPASYEFRVL
jgi:hypothetical protein